MKYSQPESLFGDEPSADAPKLGVVRARFSGERSVSFGDLVSGCARLRVLTYSNSLALIRTTAVLVPEMEIIFGREDIVGEAEKLYFYQDELVRAMRAEISSGSSGNDALASRVADGTLALRVVKETSYPTKSSS